MKAIFVKGDKNMDKKRVVAYIRIRTGEAININCEYFKRMFENHRECELTDYYCDMGKSGMDCSRLEFSRMMADAESGKFDYIIVKNLAKLSRDTVLAVQTIRKLKGYGIGIYSVTERLDTLNQECDKYLELMLATEELRGRIKDNERKMAVLTSTETAR